jgi:hypothetical protein
MVRHQAISPDFDFPQATILRHKVKVLHIVFITKESLESAVTSLGNVVRHARCHHASHSNHIHIIPQLDYVGKYFFKKIIKYGVPLIKGRRKQATHEIIRYGVPGIPK